MQNTITLTMIALTVVGLFTVLFTKGRWSAPFWLVLVGFVVAYPISHTLMGRVDEAPAGWFLWLFEFGCGSLVATLLAPLYHLLRKPNAKSADAPAEPDTADAPGSLS
jgi:hypothetical protein